MATTVSSSTITTTKMASAIPATHESVTIMIPTINYRLCLSKMIDVNNPRLPPPSKRIQLRADCDYSNVPQVVKFQPEYTVASSISAPKIVTVIATDGKRYKQLVRCLSILAAYVFTN